MKYLPFAFWMPICLRGLWTWSKNAREARKNLASLQTDDSSGILVTKADTLMDNLRAIAFLNGFILGMMSLFVTAKVSWALTPLYLRIFGDYYLVVIIGSFFIFMVNGEIHAYVRGRVKGER